MIKVYIAGKLGDNAVNYNINKKKMMFTALEVKKLGFAVYIPCQIESLAAIDKEYNWTYEDYFNNSQPWLEVSDAVLLVPGWETSEGTKKEIALAESLDIPVYKDLNKLRDDFS